MGRRIAPSHLIIALSGFAGTLLNIGVGHALEIKRSNAGHCAAYGPGFSAVAGSDTCIRIGGRVRVEAGNGGFAPNTGWANDGGIVRAGATDLPGQTSHLRLTESTLPVPR